MQSAPTGFQSYAPDLSMDRWDRRASKQVTSRHPQTAVALGALAAASVAAGAAFYLWPSGEQPSAARKTEELPMTGVLLGTQAEPPGPSIEFSHPLVSPEEVRLRGAQAGLRSAERESPASRSRQVPASTAAAVGRETEGQELVRATTHGGTSVLRVAADARLPDSSGPPSPQIGRLQTDVEAASSAMAEALASAEIGGRSKLDAPASTPSSSTDARFLPIMDGIVAPGSGASAERLFVQGSPRTGGQGALSASVPVATAAPSIAEGENGLSDNSSSMPAPALAELSAPPAFFDGAVEQPVVAALSGSGERDRDDQPSSLTTDTPHSRNITQSARLVDEPKEGPGLAGNARGLSEEPDRDFDAALSANMDPSLTGTHQLDARSVNEAAPARGEEDGHSTAAPFASETLALQSTAQASAQPRIAHSVIISEDDRVAFARSESAGGPDQVSTSQIATISLASSADKASEAYSDDGASTPGAIALAHSDDGTIQLRLGDLIALLEDKMERPLFVWLSSAESASKYVTFDTLRAAGIGVDYDPVHNHIVLSVADGEGK